MSRWSGMVDETHLQVQFDSARAVVCRRPRADLTQARLHPPLRLHIILPRQVGKIRVQQI